MFVWKVGTEPHVNTVELGKHGRYRTNVWSYAGVNTLKKGRMAELAMHPTVKPVAMIMDAIKDCSKRGEIVLDGFGGSGSTLIAAEKTKRKARRRVRAALRRRDDQALGGSDQQEGDARRHWRDLRGGGRAARRERTRRR